MSTLRKALANGSPADVIETVPRAGYRLAVPVRAAVAADPAASAPPIAQATTLAVRTFATADLAEADSYLGVGIADAVTTALGTVPGFTVSPVEAVDDLAGARSLGVGASAGRHGAAQRRAPARLGPPDRRGERPHRMERAVRAGPDGRRRPCRTRSPRASRPRCRNRRSPMTMTCTAIARGRRRPTSCSSRRGPISSRSRGCR